MQPLRVAVRRVALSVRRRRPTGAVVTGVILGAVALAAMMYGQDHIRLAVVGSWLKVHWLVVPIGVLALLLGCVLVFPRRLAPPRSEATLAQVSDPAERTRLVDERLKLQNDIRSALLQTVGGAAVIAGVFFTWQQLQTDRDQLHQQLIVTQQGQVAERFTRAIDQLGSSKLDVQLGGIYGLKQIARQAANDPQVASYRLQVYEVLTAYIRRHAAGIDAAPQLNEPDELQQRVPGVQVALTVLARRTTSSSDPVLDLHGADLRRADALGFRLEGVNLRDARLEGASLGRAHLEEARLDGAILDDANLNHIHLEKAGLFDASLRGTLLVDAHLEGAYLVGAFLEGAIFEDAHLQDASFLQADLKDANFERANLEGAEFLDANLEGANLKDAYLVGATANKKTVWPKGFDWRAAGVQIFE